MAFLSFSVRLQETRDRQQEEENQRGITQEAPFFGAEKNSRFPYNVEVRKKVVSLLV